METIEYTHLIDRIIAAEHQAREIAREAKAREATLDEDIAREAEALYAAHMDKARGRVAQVEASERELAAHTIAKLDRDYQAALAAVEAAYEKNRAQWVSLLVNRIVGEEL